MARISSLEETDVSPEYRERFQKNVAAYGTVLNSTGIYAYCPTIMNGFTFLGASIEESGQLSRQLRCLLNVRVATLVGCPF